MEATEVSKIDVDPTGRIVGCTDSPPQLDSPCQVKTAATTAAFMLIIFSLIPVTEVLFQKWTTISCNCCSILLKFPYSHVWVAAITGNVAGQRRTDQSCVVVNVLVFP